jgi:putative nucleotidyltransferase with HDIG domain
LGKRDFGQLFNLDKTLEHDIFWLNGGSYMVEENDLQRAFFDLPVSRAHQLNIRAYLEILRLKHRPTYDHSIRVGVLCLRAAQALGLNLRALFWGGTLHDIGKALVDLRILQKTSDFSKKDYAAVRPHPILGYHLLKGLYPYTAELVVRHHRFQPNPYPKRLPKPTIIWSKRILANFEKQARLLALVDFYDALTQRRNTKFIGGIKTDEQLRQIFYDSNSDMSAQIDSLIRAGVFFV